jgi:hypothetical protein
MTGGPRRLLIAAVASTFLLGSTAAGGTSTTEAEASGLNPAASFVPSFVAAEPIVQTVPGTLSTSLRAAVATAPTNEVTDYETPSPAGPMPPAPAVHAPDPALQSTTPTTDMPSPALTFEGISNLDNRTILKIRVRPPDNEGDVGPNHYVEWINLLYAVYDKTGTKLLGPLPGNSIFTALPGSTSPCEQTNQGDPLVTYDQLADRWVLSQFAFQVDPQGNIIGPFFQCVAVSRTPDPTGLYCLYPFQIPNDTFNDYGKIAMWPDAYYFSFAGFLPDDTFTPAVMAVDRQRMITPDPATGGCQTASLVYFDSTNNPALNSSMNRVLPSDLDGPTLPPGGAPNYYLTHVDDPTNANDHLELWEFHVDWTTPANSTFTKKTDLPVPFFETSFACQTPPPGGSSRQCVPQPGTTNRLDLLANRLMYELNYRNFGDHESLVVNQTVDATSADRAGVRWYEVHNPSTTPFVHQAGTFSPDTDHRWMGSAAQDRQGNLAVGYSVGSENLFPSIRYAGRLATDPLHVLAQGEATLQAGGGSQLGVTSSSPSANARWGDYTRLTVDPVDDCTFWYINEYYSVSSDANWQTRIGAFKFPECSAPTAVAVRSFRARWNGGHVLVSWRTASEANAVGFNFYRSAGSEPFRKVNRAVIPATHAGTPAGAAYRFVDRGVRRAAAYTYRLQLVGKNAKRSWYAIGSAATG